MKLLSPKIRSSLIGVVALLYQTECAVAALYNSIIQTNYGSVQGIPAFNSSPNGNISNWQDITVWKGIPYGADTSGQNRWRPPQNVSSWNTTFKANSFGDTCPPTTGTNAGMSEDCLNLNIWSSGNSTAAKLPVVLWSCPAGGSAAQPLFDGAGMASQGIVFVNYNYRVSTFGYLATPELSQEFYQVSGSNSSGNWGLLDQIAVLKWVHANIVAFGGDPDHITVMGQSAGSAAVYHFVNSPLTKDLIVGAIAESGTRSPCDPEAATLAENYRTLSAALSIGESYLASKNLTSISQLRTLSTADLIEEFFGSAYNFGNVLDYHAIPDTYYNTLLSGPANDVPYITGNTKDESGASTTTNLTVAQYVSDIETQYGNLSSRILSLYPANTSSQADMAYNAHWRDTSLISSYSFAQMWQKTAKSPIYTYYWDHAPPGQSQGAHHESEINYVLNNLYGTSLPWESVDYEIALKMNGYWANFAKTGNPNLGGSYRGTGNLTAWKKNEVNSTKCQEVGDGFGSVPIAKPGQIAAILTYFGYQTPF